MPFILYLAKPPYGGWVTFTAHLALKYDLDVFKITASGGSTLRPLGYGKSYKNISIKELEELIITGHKPLVSAVDKTFHHVLDYLPNGTPFVIHDPTEVNLNIKPGSKKREENLKFFENLKRFNIITIRQTVHDFLLKELGIKSTFLLHPYVPTDVPSVPKHGAISISRIDFDKNTDIIIYANDLLDNKDDRVEIYGAKNDLYDFHNLQCLVKPCPPKPPGAPRINHPENMELYNKGFLNQYRKTFGKNPSDLISILAPKLFVVDCSTINKDGGGSQYTFLEAINANCVLILNQRWVNVPGSIWKDGVNCLVIGKREAEIQKAISDIENELGKKLTKTQALVVEKRIAAQELAEILQNPPSIVNKIIVNAREILHYHCSTDWSPVLFPKI